MEVEFLIKVLLGVIGAALIAGGIVAIVRSNKTGSKVWGAASIAAGVVMWVFILFTTIVTQTS